MRNFKFNRKLGVDGSGAFPKSGVIGMVEKEKDRIKGKSLYRV